MIRDTIGRAASGAQLIAAILVTLGALRFAVGGVMFAVESRAARLPRASTAPPPGTAAPPAPAGKPQPRTIPSGHPARPTLSISAGPPRSEVYVNGVRRGQTPFLGEVSCKIGAPVRIEVVPPRGAPLTYDRRCLPGTIRIAP